MPAPEPELPPPPEPIPAPLPPASSGATAALLQQSRQQTAGGDFAMATSSLERALRINPRDPELWLELGRLKLRQGDFAQAENMGRRGLAVAGADATRRAQCEELIAWARQRSAE
jgi:Flp pilus assembly protein TadD